MIDESLQQRISNVRQRMAAACQRVGRPEDSVRLVAVSKAYPPDYVEAAVAAGCDCFGESRVQEAIAKIDACPGHLEWHFIGHLQRNKVPPVVGAFSLIHAVDSLRLLERIEQCAAAAGTTVRVCLEINTSGESSKFGFAPSEVPPVLDQLSGMRHVDVEGLMTMAPFVADPEQARPCFRALRDYRDRWSDASGFALPTLSMGMSNDFEVAIEEGATLVRIGSLLFGKRPPVDGRL